MGMLIRALRETFASPYTYIGSAAVGGLSWAARDARLGWLVPFAVPFVVQAFARFIAMRELNYRKLSQNTLGDRS